MVVRFVVGEYGLNFQQGNTGAVDEMAAMMVDVVVAIVVAVPAPEVDLFIQMINVMNAVDVDIMHATVVAMVEEDAGAVHVVVPAVIHVIIELGHALVPATLAHGVAQDQHVLIARSLEKIVVLRMIDVLVKMEMVMPT